MRSELLGREAVDGTVENERPNVVDDVAGADDCIRNTQDPRHDLERTLAFPSFQLAPELDGVPAIRAPELSSNRSERPRHSTSVARQDIPARVQDLYRDIQLPSHKSSLQNQAQT